MSVGKRILVQNKETYTKGPIVYWMSREQRVHDNWALLIAQKKAIEYKVPLIIVFCLQPKFLQASLRAYDFMLQGLQEVAKECVKKNIYFTIITGDVGKEMPRFLSSVKAGALVSDFMPLKIQRVWQKKISKTITIPWVIVDGHNVVPVWQTSSKLEFAARTIRPKITRLLSEYLTDIPKIKKHPHSYKKTQKINWQKLYDSLVVNTKIAPVTWLKPGYKAGMKEVDRFIIDRFFTYNEGRNDPNQVAQSNLSPYLHFGHISAQRVAREIQEQTPDDTNQEAFLEELIVRKELSDNYCWYNPNYDSFAGFPAWAQKTLHEHRNDDREYVYSLKQFEQADTHDSLWNAAQMEMVKTGKMHGYMRMYWAKKILEWTETPEEALKIAITLNDAYELDGRDPNGYVGVAWSIGGVHDRAWTERPVFGKIRYMNANGCRRKFDVEAYIIKCENL